jgi:hypothetical protein
MKKSISILSLLLGLFVCIPFLASCGDDDDEDGRTSANSLIGTWYVVSDHEKSDPYTEMSFYEDNTCSWRAYKADRSTITDSDHGTYKVEGNVLSIWWDSEKGYGPLTCTFSISGNKMTTSEGGGTIWTRK